MISQNSNRSAIVFGATGSVGTALARNLAEDGARLLLAGRSTERLRDLGDELDSPTVEVDSSRPDSFKEAFREASESIGPIHAVANCIGSVLLKPAHLTTDDDWAATMQVNAFSSFAILREAAAAMRSSGGSIVLFSSAAVRIGLPNHEAIAAAKGAVEGLVKSAAATYAARGIRVNAIAPGLVKSEMTRRIWESETSAAASEQMHALGRLGEPEDVAGMAAWLMDPANSWVTGQVIGVDGGLASVVARRRGS
ncbi:3-oxoacyl-[acyl-carrier-protein] reductase FabG [Maioricimonas rarisocia]|uniref:3-oxoacyl-[acyl-carrier-protein] reductase FabG n=1 Tax=Maioricimonas rarisocia TaxID=2528026 RepID=A0A517Z5P5_9PLAN|nr:SDR family oxidoreductase [Maioricimonas rarisocia]QDU37787.1 3-oxoacyl-[acyl-carrier-protein] reductase FabG [Maioricimonas rarisocia]